MKSLAQMIILALAVLMLAGCAWVPQRVTIAPQLNLPRSNAGNGATVVVRVQDLRPSLRIGYRGLDAKGAEITTDQDLVAVFQQKIVEGLVKQGFKAALFSEEPSRILKVEIRGLQYTTDMEMWKGSVRTKASIQAYSKAGDSVYDKLYTAEREEKAIEAPGAKTNERLLNGAVSDVLQQLLGDLRLLALLAS